MIGAYVVTIISKGSNKEAFLLISERIELLSDYEEVEQTNQII